MENEPLLPLRSPRLFQLPPLPPLHPSVSLPSLPEEDEIPSSPRCFTPSSLKDRLIFGPSLSNDDDASPSLFDALITHHSSATPRLPPSNSMIYATPRVSNLGLLSTPRYSAAQLPLLEPDRSSSDPFLLASLRSLWPSNAQTKPGVPPVKKCLHRSKTAPAMAVINEFPHPKVNTAPKQLESQSIVRSAVVLLVVYLSLGVAIYWINRHQFEASVTNPVVDALYFCIVTMCTIGYGDITPESTATKLFSILFVLVGFGFIDILLSGMVSFVLDLQESYLLKTVKGGKDLRSILIDVKKGRMRIRMKVAIALGVVVLCIGVGAGVMHFVEQLDWLDSFYLSVMSVTTVGYGDEAFKTATGRLFASVWLLVSTLAVARAFLYLAEARVDKRHRKIAKCVLGEDLTVAQFLAADMDNNGFVSKSEYVIYKLKELGKVSETEILQICKKFEQLDVGNCGRITLADLM